jgi:hypothetical protein
MARWLATAPACLALVLGACATPVQNQATTVYPLLSGTLQLRYTLDQAGVAEVDYYLDGQLLTKSTDKASQFGVKVETGKYPNGLHLLHVVPLDASALPLAGTIDNTVVFQN